jgi:uracil-DNA glycosylase family 4
MSVLQEIKMIHTRMNTLPLDGKEVHLAINEVCKLYQIEKLNRYVHTCADCNIPKEEAVTLRVPGSGNVCADIMLVGEGPGEHENMIGVPFTGISGCLLRVIGYRVGLDIYRDTWLTNMIKCHPKGNRTPTEEEARFCGRFIEREIEIIRPKVIVAVGGVAMKYFIPDAESVGKARGMVFDYTTRGRRSSYVVPVIVTWHPAYVIRKTGDDFTEACGQLAADLQKAIDIAIERAFAC